MSENNIKEIMDTTIDKIRTMVDADTIIGQPIVLGQTTVIPVSKVSFGLATGGSDFSGKHAAQPMFGGGGGAGVSISPVAFLAVNGGEVKLMQIYKDSSAADKAVAMVPELFDKISALFKKDKKEPEPIDQSAGI